MAEPKGKLVATRLPQPLYDRFITLTKLYHDRLGLDRWSTYGAVRVAVEKLTSLLERVHTKAMAQAASSVNSHPVSGASAQSPPVATSESTSYDGGGGS